MGNCFSPSATSGSAPIEKPFRLPAPLPAWPQGKGFATGVINLGGLEVAQVSTFSKLWSTPDSTGALGATFFTPSPVPAGFSVLGCYAQPNNKPLFGWVLVGRDVDGTALASPVDHTLLWTSESLGTSEATHGYVWLPVAPQGYAPVGLLVTTTPDKPTADAIRCVRADLVDPCETDASIWAASGSSFNAYSLRPSARGTQATGVPVGTFGGTTPSSTSLSLSCLKNKNLESATAMPTLGQIEALAKAYAPVIYFHPEDPYLVSSVNWYFANGALLYDNSTQPAPAPSPIDPDGANLPQGGSNDGAFWIDLPADAPRREAIKRGDLPSAAAYVHVKPMLGGTFTDLAVWVFYPFNGPGTAKVGPVNIPLCKIGEHVGDWEHVTLRVSNFTGELWRVYLSEHSSGVWVDAPEAEFDGEGKTNKVVAYASLHGHAFYAKPGLVLQGVSAIGVGIRNDTARGGARMDTGERWEAVAAGYLEGEEVVVEPAWLNYYREWGPKITYCSAGGGCCCGCLPAEVYGEEGPTGPKEKSSWNGDEK